MKNIIILIGIALQVSTLCLAQHSQNKYKEHIFCARKYTSNDIFKSVGFHKATKKQLLAPAQTKVTEGLVDNKKNMVSKTAVNNIITANVGANADSLTQLEETQSSEGLMAMANESLTELERLEREYLRMHKIIVKKLAANEVM